MKTIAFASLAMALAFTGLAFGVDMGSIAWNESNIKTLRSSDKAAIFEFVTGGAADRGFTQSNILEFAWYDLAGNDEYQLAYD